jgi:cellulose synthase (UDP-forming)
MTFAQYTGASQITGPLQPNTHKVRFKPVLDTRERNTVKVVFFLFLVLQLTFIGYIVTHGPNLTGQSTVVQMLSVTGFIAMILLQLIALIGSATTLNFAYRAVDPVPMVPKPGLRVAMLTTIVPSKEPWEIAKQTLLKFKEQDYDGVVDAWVLDEGNDPVIAEECRQLGINHFSRKGLPRWNQTSGPFRAKTKHGNHNAWREAHEHNYDIITQMDPDHVPLGSNDFLQRTLGYFADPDVAFVVAPQVYGNCEEGLIAKGAAELAYIFHGVIQRGGNALDAPLLIGTNHAIRPAAFQQIGGYQDCIIEDHLTAMVIPQTVNAETGNRWKGVYTPDILTVGEGPSTWSDFFGQQARWAYGIFEIATKHTPKGLLGMSWGQRVTFASLQFFYPSLSLAFVLGNLLSAIYLLFGVGASQLTFVPWLLFITSTSVLGLGITFWLRRFNLMPHERKSWGMTGMLLNLVTTPVYLAAGFAQLTGRSLVYRVTAKGRLSTGDDLQVFRTHIGWIVFALVCIAVGVLQGHDYPTLYFWMSITALIAATPIVLFKLNSQPEPAVVTAKTEVFVRSDQVGDLVSNIEHGRIEQLWRGVRASRHPLDAVKAWKMQVGGHADHSPEQAANENLWLKEN